MIRSNCPYCGKNNTNNFKLTSNGSSRRNINCKVCNVEYNVDFYVEVKERTIKGKLESSLPQDKIELVRKVFNKYVGYKGKGGYENRQDIHIVLMSERYNYSDNCLELTLKGKSTSYQNTSRTIEISISRDRVGHRIYSQFSWAQNWWWGNYPNSKLTLEERLERYIDFALVKWNTI